MKVLNYISYALTSIFIPQPIGTYMAGRGLFNDSNTWPTIIIAGLTSGVIFSIFALIDMHLRKTKSKRGPETKYVKKDKEGDK